MLPATGTLTASNPAVQPLVTDYSLLPVVSVLVPVYSAPSLGLNLPGMMSCSRRLASLASVRPRFAIRTYTSTVPRLSENRIPANDATPPAPASKADVAGKDTEPSGVPIESLVKMENQYQEDPVVAEAIRSLQAPNRATTWAASQQPREQAMTGPRFEQTIMETQVCQPLPFLRKHSTLCRKVIPRDIPN